jgi:hypothetical protein
LGCTQQFNSGLNPATSPGNKSKIFSHSYCNMAPGSNG